jgi:hypothetical protein
MYLVAALALLALPQARGFQTDTTFAVTQGTRLRVDNQGGDIVIRAWDRNQVRVQAAHSRRARVLVKLSGAVLTLETRAERGPPSMADYEISAPAWMPLHLGGMYANVTVEGSRAPIEVETLEGDITVKGGAETVKLTSIQGRISVSGVRGRLELNSVSEDVEVSDIQGRRGGGRCERRHPAPRHRGQVGDGGNRERGAAVRRPDPGRRPVLAAHPQR